MPSTSEPRRRVRRLTKFLCDDVSICKTPANELARIVIAKSGDRTVSVLPEAEVDEDRQYVAGWASVVEVDGVPVLDSQNDTMTVPDLVESAAEFMRHHRKGKDTHKGSADKIEYTESVVFTAEVQRALGIDLGFVGWWLGGKVKDPDLWQSVRSGVFRGFSVGGSGVRLLVEGEVEKAKKRGGYLSLEAAYRQTPPVSFQAIAKAVRAVTPRKPAKAASAQRQAVPPKVTAPPAPKPSTAGIEAARRTIAQASPQRRESVKVMERIATPRTAADHARNALAGLLAAEAAEREGKAAPSGNRALDAGRAAIRRLTQAH